MSGVHWLIGLVFHMYHFSIISLLHHISPLTCSTWIKIEASWAYPTVSVLTPIKSSLCLISPIDPIVFVSISFLISFSPLPGATTPQTQLNNHSAASNNNNNNNNNNITITSTTSPNSSPANVPLTNSSQLTPPHTDENDNNLNDERFENDNISVTGSPTHANSTEDDERRSPSPFQSATLPQGQTDAPGNGGAFTSLNQRNTKKSDFLSNFQTHLHQRPTAAHPLHQLPQQNRALNHALAAQLFLQSPLIPQPSQWLYSQLYGSNYNELPWLRSSLQSTLIDFCSIFCILYFFFFKFR